LKKEKVIIEKPKIIIKENPPVIIQKEAPKQETITKIIYKEPPPRKSVRVSQEPLQRQSVEKIVRVSQEPPVRKPIVKVRS
jgi:hypothetical protein